MIGAPVRVAGALDARLLPTPSLRLRSVVVGGPNDLGKVRADKLDVEFSLGDLMRGQWRANELTIDGMALDLGLDPQGRIDWPASSGKFNLGSLSIDRLNLTGRIALHDAASHGTLELNDIAFSGDVRSLAGSVRGDGNFTSRGTRYPFRVSSGQNADGSGTRVHLNIDPGERALSVDLEGVLSFESRAPRFEGALALAAPAAPKPKGGATDRRPGGYRPRSRPIRPRKARADRDQLRHRRARAEIRGRSATSASAPRRCCMPRCRRGSSMPTGLVAKETTRTARRAGAVVAGAARVHGGDPAAADSGADRIQRRADHAGRTSAAESGRRSAWRCEVLDDRPAGFARAGRNARCVQRRAAGPRPAASPARSTSIPPIRICWWPGCRAAARSPIAARSRCGCAAMSASTPTTSPSRAEGRDRWRRRRRTRRGLTSPPGGLALRSRAKGGTSRSRCGRSICAVAGGAASASGRTRRRFRWISAARYRPARSCAACREIRL